MFYTKKSTDAKIGSLIDQIDGLRTELFHFQDALPERIQNAIAAHELKKEAADIRASDERQKSDVPFVEIISDAYDPELGVQLQLDWNAAFIKELKSKGYHGSSERAIVNKWLVTVHGQLATQFDQADRV